MAVNVLIKCCFPQGYGYNFSNVSRSLSTVACGLGKHYIRHESDVIENLIFNVK